MLILRDARQVCVFSDALLRMRASSPSGSSFMARRSSIFYCCLRHGIEQWLFEHPLLSLATVTISGCRQGLGLSTPSRDFGICGSLGAWSERKSSWSCTCDFSCIERRLHLEAVGGRERRRWGHWPCHLISIFKRILKIFDLPSKGVSKVPEVSSLTSWWSFELRVWYHHWEPALVKFIKLCSDEVVCYMSRGNNVNVGGKHRARMQWEASYWNFGKENAGTAAWDCTGLSNSVWGELA